MKLTQAIAFTLSILVASTATAAPQLHILFTNGNWALLNGSDFDLPDEYGILNVFSPGVAANVALLERFQGKEYNCTGKVFLSKRDEASFIYQYGLRSIRSCTALN
jgi:hypothetical protein